MKNNAIVRLRLLVGLMPLMLVLLYVAWGAAKDSRAAARPLIDALERYHRCHAGYPEDLGALVRQGLLAAVPSPPRDLWASRDGFDYFVDPDLDFFCLYYREQPYFGGIGPPKRETHTYVSFRGKWDADYPRGDPAQPLGLAIERAGERFRRTRSSPDLNLFIIKLIKYSNHNSPYPKAVWAEDVRSTLGDGKVCEVDGHSGVFYEAGDAAAAGYCLISKKVRLVEEGGEEVVEIFRLDRSESPPRWHRVFRVR